jgi:hypothetical protein
VSPAELRRQADGLDKATVRYVDALLEAGAGITPAVARAESAYRRELRATDGMIAAARRALRELPAKLARNSST